jgi:hypothetical protein
MPQSERSHEVFGLPGEEEERLLLAPLKGTGNDVLDGYCHSVHPFTTADERSSGKDGQLGRELLVCSLNFPIHRTSSVVCNKNFLVDCSYLGMKCRLRQWSSERRIT